MTLQEEIMKLKEQKQAVILAHYYVPAEIQKIADYIGDSFYLSKIAVSLKEQTIVFCGVNFMAESAKLLNPNKTVLIPDASADCPMAHMASVELVRKVREQYEDVAVVCYINSTTELKEVADVCVTSANAVTIVKALKEKYIYFIPDRNLAHFVAEQVPEKEFIFNEGFCPVHEKMNAESVQELKSKYKEALVLAHPECHPTLRDMADYLGSTSGIINYAKESKNTEFIICTEQGVEEKLHEVRPDAHFHFPNPVPICQDMKKITLEKVLHVLQTGENDVQLSQEMIKQANEPLKNMLALAK